MCGIAGVVGAPADIPTLLRVLQHRGPDDQGYLVFSNEGVRLGREWNGDAGKPLAVLVHRRLSILDLSETGRQPMGNGRHYIVYNGEIYNYLELREELERLGHRFKSRSDTEVLLAGYAQWGRAVLEKLVGMFAFAILDVQERRIFLARDHFGIKPLYYSFEGDRLAFASEIKVLLTLPWIGRRIHSERLYLYLRYGLTDFGGATLLRGIEQLPAAHYMEVDLSKPSFGITRQYWKLDLTSRVDLSFEEAAGRLRELFVDSVRLHMRSDVPVGSALSGGIDSSSIVMAMRRIAGSKLDLHVFSYIADEASISEERWVDIVAGEARATVHKCYPKPQELRDDLEELIRIQDEPFRGTSIYAQHRVFRTAREAGIKVMLDGQGADEILGGYRAYLSARLASCVRQGHWRRAAGLLRCASKLPGTHMLDLGSRAMGYLLSENVQLLVRGWVGRSAIPGWLNAAWFVERGVEPRVLTATGGSEVLRHELHRSLVETGLPALLRYEDRNSMAFSIESRVPFLTPKLVGFVLSLPEQYIVSDKGRSKAVFREAMRGLVPEAILDRKDKLGFTTPEATWLHALRPWVESVLRGDAARQIPALNYPAIERQLKRGAVSPSTWHWLNLIEWSRMYGVKYE